MDEILSLDLKEHVDIVPEYLTLRSIIRSYIVQGEPVIKSIERTVETGTCKFLYHAGMEEYVKDLMEGIDEHIRQVGDWETCINSLERMKIKTFGPAMPSNSAVLLSQPLKLTTG
jgi:hypothetical protein